MSLTSFRQFVCLTGLPRTGSTLLSAILSQNPLIHAEGNSPICQFMWEVGNSFITCQQQFEAANKAHLFGHYLQYIPHLYYKNITETIVVDKCRSWTIEKNYMIATHYIDPNIKMIVMIRPIIEIVASFAKLYYRNGMTKTEVEKALNDMLEPDSEPIIRSAQGVQNALIKCNPNAFLFINYDDLIQNPQQTITRIYDFCGWTYYPHDFKNIKIKYPENDEVYGIRGIHDIRSTISKEETDINKLLTEDIIKKCNEISKELKL